VVFDGKQVRVEVAGAKKALDLGARAPHGRGGRGRGLPRQAGAKGPR
jgi:hypothetical protein